MRSVDWIVFLIYVVPTVVCDQLQEQYGKASRKVCDAVEALVKGCSIALLWHITKKDIVAIEK